LRTDTLFQICFYFCVCMLVFTLSLNFVVASGFYQSDTTLTTGLEGQDANSTISDITTENIANSEGGFSFENVWGWAIGIEIVGALVIGWLFKDARILGVYIFGAVFWTSYISMLTILSIVPQVNPFEISNPLFVIIHAACIMTFIGAIVGMFTNAG